MSALQLFLHGMILAVLLLALFGMLANLATFGSLKKAPVSSDAPRVSVLVPARNEELNIRACVSSLLAQVYPDWQLIVLDDHSTDATGIILEELGLRMDDPQRRLLRGQPLPPGWTGKGWACHQLAQAADGDYLLFLDADTQHQPGMLAAAIAQALRTRADLLSAWPRLITGTWGEHLIVPMILVLGMTLYPHWLLTLLQKTTRGRHLPARIRRSLGAANGQFMMFRRAAYERIGGHAAIRAHLVEDVALGRAIAARMHEGLRLINCDALAFSTVRMYRSFGEVWEGFTKNVRPAFEESTLAFLCVGALQATCLLLPCILVFFPRAARPAVVLEVALIYLIRLLLTMRFRTSWWSFLFHPIGVLLGLAIGLNSWWRSSRGGVTWKGRTYPVVPMDYSEPAAKS